MDSDDSYSDCSTDTDTLQSQREAIGRASFRNCMRGAYFNIQHTGNYRRRVTKLLKIIREFGGEWSDDLSSVQYIFVLLAHPRPRTMIAVGAPACRRGSILEVYANRTYPWEDDERGSRICAMQPEFVYDVLSGADFVKALERWEIIVDNRPSARMTANQYSGNGHLPNPRDAATDRIPGISIAQRNHLLSHGPASLPVDQADTSVSSTGAADVDAERLLKSSLALPDKASYVQIAKDATPPPVIPNTAIQQDDKAMPVTAEVIESTDPVSIVDPDQKPVFSRNQALPMSFHVLTGPTRSVVEKMIIDDGGGTIVPRSRASILVDPTKDKTNEFELWVSPDGSRASVSLGWVLRCLETNSLVDLKEYASREI